MHAIPVYFTSRMVADARSFSPSAVKPAAVLDAWLRLGPLIEVREPAAATLGELCMAHDRDFVEGVLGGDIDNGFGNRLAQVAASLSYTTGAMLSAAREALANGQVAVAPCSGFHHARWAGASGFCTFNGLMVTAAVLKHEGLARRIGILDCDQHWGDGTDQIIRQLDASGWVRHYSPVEDFSRVSTAERFIAALPAIVSRFTDCDLVLYQAGADPHVDDPLGGWLTTAQLYRRDAAVFSALKALKLPVAWNLAGGYQQPLSKVVAIHQQTMVVCCRVYAGVDDASI